MLIKRTQNAWVSIILFSFWFCIVLSVASSFDYFLSFGTEILVVFNAFFFHESAYMTECLPNGAVPCLSIDSKTSPISIFSLFHMFFTLVYPAWFQLSFFFWLGKGATIKPDRSHDLIKKWVKTSYSVRHFLWIDKSKEFEDGQEADLKCRSNQTIMIDCNKWIGFC